MDYDVWKLKRYWFNDDNNNFNYVDIDKEILQFEYQSSIGESETIVFHDCDDVLNATLQEEGSAELEWTLKKYQTDNNNTADTELEWILKKYRVDNNNTYDTKMADITPVLQLEIQVVSVMS